MQPDSILTPEAPRKRPRDTCTRLCKAGRLSLLLEWRDAWVGVYAAPRAWYFGGPFLVFRWERRG